MFAMNPTVELAVPASAAPVVAAAINSVSKRGRPRGRGGRGRGPRGRGLTGPQLRARLGRGLNKRQRKLVNRMATLKGRGAYSWAKYIPAGLGAAGAMLTGGDADAGWNMGREYSKKVLGWGDYAVPWNVSSNSMVSAGNVPAVHNAGDSGFHITHREYIGTLFSSNAFKNNVFYINPGLPGTFPWLSKLSANFQEYQLTGMLVSFKSSLTNALASFASMGSVMIACDMNPAQTPATSQMTMEQMQFVASAKPADSFVAPVECAPSKGGAGVKFIRVGGVPTGASICDYDHGVLQVATVGQPSDGVELGRLYLSYDIVLLNPRLNGIGAPLSHWVMAPSSFSATMPFGIGASPPTPNYDTIGISFVQTPATGYATVSIPPGSMTCGQFMAQAIDAGGLGAAAYPTFTLTNATNINYYKGTANAIMCPATGTVAQLSYIHAFQITDQTQAATITFAWTSLTTTAIVDYQIISSGNSGLIKMVPTGFNNCQISAPEEDDSDEESLVSEPVPPVTGAAAGAAGAVLRKVLR